MAKDVPITFFHLANYTSGYALPEAPGTAWAHNDYANKLYLFLVYGLLGVDPRNSTELNAAITTPERMGSLQFQDGQIVALRAGTPRLTTSIRDTARIAWLWANKGRWGDRQLLPRSFFNTYAKAQSYGIPRSSSHTPHDYLPIGTMGAPDPNSIPVDPSFGFGWKFNQLPNGALMFPGCPPDFFYCQGVNRFVVVVPSLNLVALWSDGAPISNAQKPAVFAQLCGIIKPQ